MLLEAASKWLAAGPSLRKRGSKQHSPLGVVGSGSAAWPGTVLPATLLLCGLLRRGAKIWIQATTLTSMLLSTWWTWPFRRPTTSRSQPGNLSDNKSCHARWTVSWSPGSRPLLLVRKPFGRIFSSCSKKARGRGHALPSAALGLHVVTPLFRTMVRLRLRLPVSDSDTPCPLCDGTCDRFGDHARVCPSGGDRVKRHHQLRNILAERAKTASLQPEVEKPNLLPPRPELQGGPEDGEQPCGGGRRPADVWLPNWHLHGPAAFDIAVTSGMRQSVLTASVTDGSRASTDYEARKCQHLSTLEACTSEGLQFVPLVVEACGGGWGGPSLWKPGAPWVRRFPPTLVKAALWNRSASVKLWASRCSAKTLEPSYGAWTDGFTIRSSCSSDHVWAKPFSPLGFTFTFVSAVSSWSARIDSRPQPLCKMPVAVLFLFWSAHVGPLAFWLLGHICPRSGSSVFGASMYMLGPCSQFCWECFLHCVFLCCIGNAQCSLTLPSLCTSPEWPGSLDPPDSDGRPPRHRDTGRSPLPILCVMPHDVSLKFGDVVLLTNINRTKPIDSHAAWKSKLNPWSCQSHHQAVWGIPCSKARVYRCITTATLAILF